MTPARSLVLGPAAAGLRREVGPFAWVVLEAAVARADVVAGVLTADVSARSLAAELGLAKNTTARALSKLREVGVLVAVQGRDRDGTFTAGSYQLHLPARSLELASSVVSPSPASPTRTRRVTPVPVEQLALLPR